MDVKIESGLPGVRDINYRRPTMQSFVKGGGDQSGAERARATALESSARSRSLSKLDEVSAQPALEFDRVTDDTRKVFGDKDSVEEARKSVLKSADKDVKNFDTEVSRQTDNLEQYKKDSTDLVKDDEFIGKAIKSGEGKIQLDLRSRPNEVTDNIVQEHNKNKADIKGISDDNYDKISGDELADMDYFNEGFAPFKKNLIDDPKNKDIVELIDAGDGSYGYFKKKIYPELSGHADELLTANPKSRQGLKLRAFLKDFENHQDGKLIGEEKAGVFGEKEKAGKFFKEQVVPYRQGTSDELTRIQNQKGRKYPDEAAVESRAVLKHTLDDPDKAEYTKRVLELVPDPKLRRDYVLGSLAEEISDTVAMLEPDEARQVESLINNIESKKLTTKQMTEQLDILKEDTKDFKERLYKGELKKFLDEDGLINTDGDQIFGEYLSDEKGGNKIKQLINRIKSSDNPVALDGLKSTYSKKLKDAFRGGRGAAGEKNINENIDLEKLFEYGDIIHSDNPKVMNMFRSLQKESVDSASFRNAKKATMSDINQFDKDASFKLGK